MVTQVRTNAAVPFDIPPTTGEAKVVQLTIARLKQLEARKLPWLDQYQLIGEFVHMRKQEFQEEHLAGEFLTREIFDPSAPKAAKTSASTLISMLWPSTKNRFKFLAPETLKGTQEEKEYYSRATKKVLKVMDNPKAGYALSLGEYMLDQVTFGTSGIESVKDKDTLIRYTPWGVGNMLIDEGKNSVVDTIYLVTKRSNQWLVKNYGLDKVSPRTRAEFNDGKFDIEKTLIIAIEPRTSKVQGKSGNKNMPFSSVHIEKETKHLLKESGFAELPIPITRFTKLIGEVYARSLAMDALPDILQSNALWEALMMAVEKSLDPPAGVYSDGVLGGGEIDTSPGAINVFNPSDQAKDRAPYFQLFTVGEFRQMKEFLVLLNERISNHFLIDRLLDFNNETRMTATETTLRDRMRSATLGQIFSIQINSRFIPDIERSFNMLLDMDELGVMPDSDESFEPGAWVIPQTIADLMTSGEDVFQFEFFTPATRIMQSEEAEGILRTTELAGTFASIGKPEALDKINADKALELFGDIVGAPLEIFVDQRKVDGVRADNRAAIEDKEEQEQITTVAGAARDIGQSGLVPTRGGE